MNGRNVMNLLALVPGVVPQGATSGAATNNQPSIGNYTNPAGWSNYQIGGGVAGQNALNLDGAPLNVPIQNWIGLIPAEDSVSEFRVDSNNLSPEFGRYYGGVISFPTKSGTNEFHGSAYEYFRNTILDANNFFNNRTNIDTAASGPKPVRYFARWTGGEEQTVLFRQLGRICESGRTAVFRPRAHRGRARRRFHQRRPIYYSGTTTQVSCNGVLNKVCPDPTAYYMAERHKILAAPEHSKCSRRRHQFRDERFIGIEQQPGDGSRRLRSFEAPLFRQVHALGNQYAGHQLLSQRRPAARRVDDTHQAVLGDTYTINSSTFADVRLSFLRFDFNSVPPALGKVDLSKFPGLAPYANQVTFNALPVPFLIGYSPSPFPLLALDVIQFYTFDTYSLTAA